ncbi:MAG: xanthine dehydrogenase family protein molybdopterin-binding subunit [Betaproteobacteria bacterium]
MRHVASGEVMDVDERRLRGGGRYVSDITPEGCLHLAFARSPHARARIGSISLSAARAIPGVAAVYTGADVAGLDGIEVNRPFEGIVVPPHPLLSQYDVFAVGEPCAAAVATSPEAARDAADLIEFELDVLDAAVGPDQARVAYRKTWSCGNVEAAFAGAHRVVRVRVEQPRLAAAPMEARATLAMPDAGGVRVWTSTQAPFRVRKDIAKVLGLEESSVRVAAPDVGGAFGAKGATYREDVFVAWAALRLACPVKWVAGRGEDFLSTQHGRGNVAEAELALDVEGRFLAMRASIVCALGSVMTNSSAITGFNFARILPGPYRVPSLRIDLEGRLSDTATVSIYRGAGRPEAAFLMERLSDAAARELDMDPAEIRRRNFVPASSMPWTSPTGARLDSGDYGSILDTLLARAGYVALRAEVARRRAAGELVGLGLASYVEPCGRGLESARVKFETDGRVAAWTGATSQGQGRERAFAQIVAAELDISPGLVDVHHGDTADLPTGVGALASRCTGIGGSALALAARRAKIEGGDATEIYEAEGEAWSCGSCLALLRIDRETGEPIVERLVLADDAGRIIDPAGAEAQLHGGIAQGLGQALLERVAYDESGQLLTGSFLDYAMPRAADFPLPELMHTETPTPMNDLGAKGLGETGCIAVPPAIVNAALDALSGLGVADLDMPLTAPALWHAMDNARRGPKA